MTTWRSIVEFPDYEVSACGRVRFLGGDRRFGNKARRVPPRERTLQPHNGGYLQLMIKGKNLYVHRLVAAAFLPTPTPERKHVNHKNGNKQDNRVENLEWVTNSENHQHKIRVLGIGIGETHSQARLTNKDVAAIRAAAGPQWTIAVKFGISRQHVSAIRSGRQWVQAALVG